MSIRNKIRLCTKQSFTILLLQIILFSSGSHLYADTFNVGPGRAHTDLQSVASQLKSGDVVKVPYFVFLTASKAFIKGSRKNNFTFLRADTIAL